MSSKPVLIIVTANTCSPCRLFKLTIYDSLVQKLKASNKVDIIDIPLEHTSAKIGPEYPQELSMYVGTWFPMFILASGSSWARRYNLELSIFNGRITNGRLELISATPINEENILKWIETETSTNPIFTSNQVSQVNQLSNQPSTPSQGLIYKHRVFN